MGKVSHQQHLPRGAGDSGQSSAPARGVSPEPAPGGQQAASPKASQLHTNSLTPCPSCEVLSVLLRVPARLCRAPSRQKFVLSQLGFHAAPSGGLRSRVPSQERDTRELCTSARHSARLEAVRRGLQPAQPGHHGPQTLACKAPISSGREGGRAKGPAHKTE